MAGTGVAECGFKDDMGDDSADGMASALPQGAAFRGIRIRSAWSLEDAEGIRRKAACPVREPVPPRLPVLARQKKLQWMIARPRKDPLQCVRQEPGPCCCGAS